MALKPNFEIVGWKLLIVLIDLLSRGKWVLNSNFECLNLQRKFVFDRFPKAMVVHVLSRHIVLFSSQENFNCIKGYIQMVNSRQGTHTSNAKMVHYK